jgi:hypothetical protein
MAPEPESSTSEEDMVSSRKSKRPRLSQLSDSSSSEDEGTEAARPTGPPESASAPTLEDEVAPEALKAAEERYLAMESHQTRQLGQARGYFSLLDSDGKKLK